MQAIISSHRLNGSSRARTSVRGPGLALALALALALGIVGCSSASPAEPEPTAMPAPVVQERTEPTDAQPEPETDAKGQNRPQPQVQPPVDATEAAPEPTAVSQEPATPMSTSEAAQPATETPAATATPEPARTLVPSTAPAEMPDVPTATPEAGPASGGGYVVGEGSKATFTVNETLAWLDLPIDAVMQTSGLSGHIYLDGRASEIDLDVHSMTSDSDRRDGYVKRRMFPDHRTATFTVADLGDLPDPLPEGEVITREVQGELDIRGVTKPILFQIEARLDPGKLFVVGRTTFTWDELEIPPPNIPGRIQVKDEVRVEVLLAATPDAG